MNSSCLDSSCYCLKGKFTTIPLTEISQLSLSKSTSLRNSFTDAVTSVQRQLRTPMFEEKGKMKNKKKEKKVFSQCFHCKWGGTHCRPWQRVSPSMKVKSPSTKKDTSAQGWEANEKHFQFWWTIPSYHKNPQTVIKSNRKISEHKGKLLHQIDEEKDEFEV